jgi:hypothetical protein
MIGRKGAQEGGFVATPQPKLRSVGRPAVFRPRCPGPMAHIKHVVVSSARRPH